MYGRDEFHHKMLQSTKNFKENSDKLELISKHKMNLISMLKSLGKSESIAVSMADEWSKDLKYFSEQTIEQVCAEGKLNFTHNVQFWQFKKACVNLKASQESQKAGYEPLKKETNAIYQTQKREAKALLKYTPERLSELVKIYKTKTGFLDLPDDILKMLMLAEMEKKGTL